jgi:hypothetical protein
MDRWINGLVDKLERQSKAFKMEDSTKYVRNGFLMTCVFAISVSGCCSHTLRPKGDLVPDAETAVAIAHALIKAHYGERELSEELPLVATLTNGVWKVKGTLPKGWVGGVGVVKISKSDGRILEVHHYK